ncbi:MAG: rhodanese-related sulfurtransferase [Pseudomonadota bacterium]
MVVVAAFYRFSNFPSYAEYQAPLAKLGCSSGVKGTILLAREGVNGTVAGERSGVEAVLAALRAIPGFAALEHKESEAVRPPFRRLKVRLKKEIVTMGIDVDVANDVGDYVEPEHWDALIKDPDVLVVDARNAYEVAIGSFDGAVNPETDAFGELPGRLDRLAAASGKKKIAMFCTGGIRCEKATAYARRSGFDDVYHLKGGILKYLEQVEEGEEGEGAWRGQCYVFDERVSVGYGLKPGDYAMCHACGWPVSPADMRREEFEEGASCHRCVNAYSDADRERFRERHRQFLRRVAGAADDREGNE